MSYDRSIRGLLADNCFKCHGPDERTRTAGLRLDLPVPQAGANGPMARAIIPGDPVASTLLHRIDLPDGAPGHMPPSATGKRIGKEQRELLRRWIAEGAHYERHWSFVPPRTPAIPKSTSGAHPVDAFLAAARLQAGLGAAPEADRSTLIRRLSLDVTGLPPTPEEVDRFVSDRRPDAYARLVDRLLASPHYGERMAIGWLDLARYADTHGYHIDSHRDMFRWRDWVIEAFNRNLPFDQFASEQIAGDLLLNATLDQRIATGFNRNHPINFEGGAIPEEYQTAYVADRVDTTSTVFLGLTLRCAQCHDHKFDPVSQSDYYRFFAYFNNIDEEGLDGMRGNAKPFLPAPTAEQSRRLDDLKREAQRMESERSRLEKGECRSGTSTEAEMRTALARVDAQCLRAVVPSTRVWSPIGTPRDRTSFGRGSIALDGASAIETLEGPSEPAEGGFTVAAWVRLDRVDRNQTIVSRMDTTAGLRGWDLFVAAGGRPMAHFISQWPDNAMRVDSKETIPAGKWVHLAFRWNGAPSSRNVSLFIDGRLVETESTVDHLAGSIRTARPLRIGGRWPSTDLIGEVADVRIMEGARAPEDIARLATFEPIFSPGDVDSMDRPARIARWLLADTHPEYRRLLEELARNRRDTAAIESAVSTTMVMRERPGPRRTTRILERGQYDHPGKTVEPGLPTFLSAATNVTHGDRRDVALWLVSPENPLFARVAVNRLWQHFFGTGLVATAENFGVQGEPPSHPELLDWLAVRFRETGWNVKEFVRLLVLTKAYRQSSTPPPGAKAKDPANRLLSHAPRLRLPAELIRDQALAASGLLVREIGGPSVKPYHPAGLWEEMSFKGDFSAQYYVQDHGEKLWRRSLYVFWKRTVPPPSLQTFDAPEREFCIVRRPVTNTPLQALVTLNDPACVEAARVLAERALRETGGSPPATLVRMFRRVLGRQPRIAEKQVLLALANREWTHFRSRPDDARKLVAVGEYPPDPRLAPANVAAWTAVAEAILNLDEAVTRG
ncbi:MAG: DUF1553 domain-containing protein [Armatimonadota bacterium]